jgi:predicted MPP superfamily phosphohydrolase
MLQVLVTLILMVAAYGALNYYILHRFASFWGAGRHWAIWPVTMLLTFSFVGVILLSAQSSGAPVTIIYVLAMVWAGAVLLLSMLLGIHELLRMVWPLTPALWGTIVAVTSLCLLVFSLTAGNVLTVKEVAVEADSIKAPMRIVHLTDLHLGAVRGDAFAARVADRVKTLDPDVIVITGDLFDGPGKYDEKTLARFTESGVPVLFSYGNHEYYVGERRVDTMMNKTSIVSLRNTSRRVGGVLFLGIDDQQDTDAIVAARDKLPRSEDFTVLLYHRPKSWSSMTDVDLQLSGHTHGGQIFPFTILVWLFERPLVGLHERVDENGRKSVLYVSPGTGTWGPPMRFGTINQIAVINLVPA